VLSQNGLIKYYPFQLGYGDNAMMNCPLCGNAAHTRSSFQVSATTKERYNQCQNINCSCTFKSHETVSEIIMKPGSVKPVPPHPGRNQQQPLWL